jgi:hypothetical protein
MAAGATRGGRADISRWATLPARTEADDLRLPIHGSAARIRSRHEMGSRTNHAEALEKIRFSTI